jgi:uncharacterized membrane protein YfcA
VQIYLPQVDASVLTAPLGAKTAHALPVKSLKKVFALVRSLMAGYMFYKAFR